MGDDKGDTNRSPALEKIRTTPNKRKTRHNRSLKPTNPAKAREKPTNQEVIPTLLPKAMTRRVAPSPSSSSSSQPLFSSEAESPPSSCAVEATMKSMMKRWAATTNSKAQPELCFLFL